MNHNHPSPVAEIPTNSRANNGQVKFAEDYAEEAFARWWEMEPPPIIHGLCVHAYNNHDQQKIKEAFVAGYLAGKVSK